MMPLPQQDLDLEAPSLCRLTQRETAMKILALLARIWHFFNGFVLLHCSKNGLHFIIQIFSSCFTSMLWYHVKIPRFEQSKESYYNQLNYFFYYVVYFTQLFLNHTWNTEAITKATYTIILMILRQGNWTRKIIHTWHLYFGLSPWKNPMRENQCNRSGGFIIMQ